MAKQDEVTAILNAVIELQRDGHKRLFESADDVKDPEIKAFMVQRAGECAASAAELEAEVQRLGSVQETTISWSGDIHSGWVNLRYRLEGKGEEDVLKELERCEDFHLKTLNDSREKLVILSSNTGGQSSDLVVATQLLGGQISSRNLDQIKALNDAARRRY